MVLTALFGLALLPYAAFFGIAAYLFLAPCYDKLSGRAFVEFFQAIDPYMKVRARRLSLLRLALTLPLLGLLYHQWAALPFWLTLPALLAAVASAGIAVRGNVPLNQMKDRWSPLDPPAGWEQVRDRWLRYHHLRGAADMAAFALLLAAALTHGQGRAPIDSHGPVPRRWEATVFLPLADNQGRPFDEAEWQDALERLIGAFGGATLGQPQEGCWRDASGRVCREWVRPVVVSFASARLHEFRGAVQVVGERLGQEAIYVRFEEPRVELVQMARRAVAGVVE